ncbi:hypothetical protein GB931_12200 [Modestobacter sp. I12A-02628]|uniref:Uncharacterized protein n=1 Tax=Goekera deserti TaxID=2497753 RepID=A0A7K3W920_9ACTN|nr:hypothetical protein [Goekera deserti]MPQ98668.1 hypothetical protein [Goekera deserti]NDI49230.1 hypothetical protein [Goekera deserti]NEL52968.1 hypothetical protein [Goekera deserti]
MTTTRTRLVLGPLAGALAVLSLTACTSSNVSCSGGSCTASLSGEDASAEILGQSLAFAGTTDGRAELRVGDQSVSCSQGESVQAGPLSITCTSVTDDGIEVTASLS